MDLRLLLCVGCFFEEHFKSECILISSLNEEQLCCVVNKSSIESIDSCSVGDFRLFLLSHRSKLSGNDIDVLPFTAKSSLLLLPFIIGSFIATLFLFHSRSIVATWR